MYYFTKKTISYYCIDTKGLEDGCPTNGVSPKPPDVITPSQTAAVRCCSDDVNDCITLAECLETTYDEAQKKCAIIGRRLCTAPELAESKCCGTGCGFDDKLNWYIIITGWFILLAVKNYIIIFYIL